MSIYPDKKNGQLTGRYTVEVMVRGQRHKGRFNSLGEAKVQEDAWKSASYERLYPVPPASPQTEPLPPEPSSGSTLYSKAIAEAKGRTFLWAGMASEQGSLERLRIIGEVMGEVAVGDIDEEWVEDLKDKLASERDAGDNTINRYLATLSKFLRWAKSRKWRGAIPDMTRLSVDGHRIRWFDLAEEAAIYDAFDAHGPVITDTYRKLIRIAIHTGMRRGELV